MQKKTDKNEDISSGSYKCSSMGRNIHTQSDKLMDISNRSHVNLAEREKLSQEKCKTIIADLKCYMI